MFLYSFSHSSCALWFINWCVMFLWPVFLKIKSTFSFWMLIFPWIWDFNISRICEWALHVSVHGEFSSFLTSKISLLFESWFFSLAERLKLMRIIITRAKGWIISKVKSFGFWGEYPIRFRSRRSSNFNIIVKSRMSSWRTLFCLRNEHCFA